jgi:hypothetical protein
MRFSTSDFFSINLPHLGPCLITKNIFEYQFKSAEIFKFKSIPAYDPNMQKDIFFHARQIQEFVVLYPERGVCADPVDEGAILGEGGGKPPSSDKERQLATDIGGGKT